MTRRMRKWIICSVCNRKYIADGDTNYPRKHYVPPTVVTIGNANYMINTSWTGNREICSGTYKEGEVHKLPQ